MTVGVLVLAAGQSVRFGSDKRLALMTDGRQLIEATLTAVRESGLPAYVCVGEEDQHLGEQLRSSGQSVYRCKRSREGMGSTLAEGISMLPEWEGVLIALADMPWIQATTYQLVAERINGSAICAPSYQGQRGHPVGFGKNHWPALAALSGPTGAAGLIKSQGQWVELIATDDPGIVRDVDRPADLS
ncbi:MAG: nucleotidyltransferase family protein [Pseudomonadota bacterium]